MEIQVKKNYAACHGCSLCLLPCPMWQQQRDVSFSPQGFAKAMQHGATAIDLKYALAHCIQCGACDVICPEQVDVQGMIQTLWAEAGLEKEPEQAEAALSGFVISCDPMVQQQLDEGDLYIIDAAPFHADYARRVEHYTQLREMRGCQINLDLNRLAVATGIGRQAAKHQRFDVASQLAWLLKGRDVERIVLENGDEQEAWVTLTGKPVVTVMDLMRKGGEKVSDATG